MRTQQSKWLFCLGVSVCAIMLTYLPEGLSLFRYDRAGLLAGQGWRIVTGHLVHLNTVHLLLNLAGLVLLVELLWGELPIKQGIGLFLIATLITSLLLWTLHPELIWYVGLSGVLHGLWSGCSLAGLLQKHEAVINSTSQFKLGRFNQQQIISLIGLSLLIAKLVMEWRHDLIIHTQQLIGAPVITEAHFYGALSGIAYVSIWRLGLLLSSGHRR
jgi:rhomboid family GlyGly-CTERM serine protease